jgi:hypothetical protein
LPSIKLFSKHGDEIDELFNDIRDLELASINTPGSDVKGRLTKVSQCLRGVAQFKNLFKGNMSLQREFDEAQRRLMRLAGPLRTAAGEGLGYRQQPVSVCLYGKPGQGKTMVSQMYITTCLKMAGILRPDATKEEASREVFCKPWNSEYMDGYCGQAAYLLDDFMMKKATPQDTSNGFLDLMTYYSNFSVMLNMAYLEGKGMFPFSSKMILMTTNLRHPDQANASQFLLCPEALQRRVDLHYEMRVLPEFQVKEGKYKGMLDFPKYEAELAKCSGESTVFAFPWHIWELAPASWVEGHDTHVPPGKGKPMLALVLETVQLLKDREASHGDALDCVEKVIKAPVTRIEDLQQYLSRERVSPSVRQESGELLPSIHEEIPESERFNACFKAVVKNMYEPGLKLVYETLENGVSVPKQLPDMCAVHGKLLHWAAFSELIEEYLVTNSLEVDHEAIRDLYDEIYRGPHGKCRCGETAANGNIIFNTNGAPTDVDREAKAACGQYESGTESDESEMDSDSDLMYADPDSFCARMKKKFHSMRESIRKYFQWWTMTETLLLSAVVAVTYTVIKFIAGICVSVWNFVVETLCGKKVEEQSNRPKVGGIKFKIQMQSGTYEGLHRLVYNNTYKLTLFMNDGQAYILGQVTFLKMDYLVMPFHFRRSLQEKLDSGACGNDSPIRLQKCGSNENVISGGITVSIFLNFPHYDVPERDLSFMRIPHGCRIFRDITKFLVSNEDLKSLGGHPVRLDTARTDHQGALIDVPERIAFMSPSVHVGSTRIRVGPQINTTWLRYYADTEVGDCGAPLCLQKQGAFKCRVWCGIHIGGDSQMREGYATQLTAELADIGWNCLSNMTCDPVKEELTERETVAQAGLYVPAGATILEDDEFPFYSYDAPPEQKTTFGSFELIGKLEKPLANPIKSKLVPTVLGKEKAFESELGECLEEPMKLAPYKSPTGELVFPMVEAMKAYAGPTHHVDSDFFRSAVKVAMQPFSSSTCDIQGRVLTFEEAVLGDPAIGMKGIPRGTSVGYPMCFEASDKTYFFGDGDEFDLTLPNAIRLKQEVLALEKLLREGKRPFFACRGFLKDETRKAGKGARYIAGTSIHYFILCRMYFGMIVSAQLTHFRQSGMCPGINPYQDWQWLYDHITNKGKGVWDGDFSAFDSSQQPTQLSPICDCVNEWYEDRGSPKVDSDVRSILFLDLMFSKHIVGKASFATHVVQWQRSLPSGHFLTAFVNSILSMSCIVASYMGTTERCDFWQTSSAATLGDDNLVNTQDELLPVFNQITTAKFIKDKFNMTYTAGRKGEELKPFLDISEVTFLQRRFSFKQDHVVCPIRFASFLTNLYFLKKGDVSYTHEVLRDNLEKALSELSMHDESDWERFKPTILDYMKRLGRTCKLPASTSSDYLKMTLQRDDFGW